MNVEEDTTTNKFKQEFDSNLHQVKIRIQRYLDLITPFTVYRWLSTTFLLFVFCLRIVLSHGVLLYSYLNLFLAFLTPKFDPSVEEDEEMDNLEGGNDESNTYGGGGGYGLGSGGLLDKDEEFRPFIRRLPEFKFWYSATRAILVSILCTTTSAFDIPVYWPILLVYFFILFSLTMRRQIEHMIKYRYIPFDLGRKVRYNSKN
ncbi:retention in the endoplasmic reticulum [Wallemia mellicola]|uniref:Protein RER1 n=1 Tax=Wallemia mellicola TaxID=1708541 RepID=A0A4T0Q521_9BASI|nr:hypothetical protein E3Q24_02479 [Wallemia mellicola]TIB97221.1 retention in the endoplasmic reticulum [Wallemia mellicola]TIC04620.1 retention in the endoplasmic reticulum [Wallemia mellicola]TIC18168.1 retention in the endoplasmic reticulum [Wallemia mellicola]TIC29459.1 retention in the endoplasmic reticulum [Wallemia mellicola]